jgi:hypothetical protein
MAMTAMRAGYEIVLVQISADTDSYGFLPRVKVDESWQLPGGKKLVHLVLEFSDQQHAFINP